MTSILRIGGVVAEGLLEEQHADPFDAAECIERFGSPGTMADEFREERQADANDAIVLGEFPNGSIDKRMLLRCHLRRVGRKPAVRLPVLDQDAPGMAHVEEVDDLEVPALNQGDVEPFHEPRRGHREIVSNDHNHLQELAVALSDRTDQFRFVTIRRCMEPLLELIDEEDDTVAAAATDPRKGLNETGLAGKLRQGVAHLRQDILFRSVSRRGDIESFQPTVDAGEEAGTDQR